MPSPAIKTRTVNISANGQNFRCRQWGESESRAVLLLHGFPQNLDTWDPIAINLASGGYCVHAFDQRGYAPSSVPDNPAAYNFDAFVADAAGVADALKIEKFYLGGFGMGAAQAWILAARYPQRVRSLAALRFPHPAAFAWCLMHDPAQSTAWENFSRMLGSKDLSARANVLLAKNGEKLRAFLHDSGLREPAISDYARRMQEPGALVSAFSWEGALDMNLFARTPAVDCPTLFIWSEGPAISTTVVDKTREFVRKNYVSEEIRDVGNFILENAPEQTAKLIRDFYDRY